MTTSIVDTRPTNFSIYAFTYQKRYKRNDIQKISDYDQLLEHLNKIGDVHEYNFEIGKVKKQLHVHGTVEIHAEQKEKLKYNGFHGKIVELYDRIGWESYIKKDRTNCIINFNLNKKSIWDNIPSNI